ncbi:MAG: 2-amino-4-hydroxy-6-hydroxymethyldihydropteridine diphosphokinase [Acutalibacteraceae bacterium]
MDKIIVSGIEFFGYHGVLESEKKNGQLFSVDCEITLDTSLCGDDLSKTVNYAEVACFIAEFSKSNRYDLIETLANELAKNILVKFSKIDSITLTVHKPNAPIPTKFSDVTLTVTRGWNVCYLAVGSNLGDREKNLDTVWSEIEKNPYIKGICKSDYIETKPYGVTDQPDFLNGAVKIKTILTPKELLRFCADTEKLCGRVRTRHWGERTLDVDILMYGDEVIFTDELKIPHPEMHKRTFVLEPLAQIEPYLVHPVRKISVSEMLVKLKKGD